MARTLSRTLTLTLARLSHPSVHRFPSPLLAVRCCSNRPEKGSLTVLELDPSDHSDPDLELMGLRRLDEAMDRILVKKATPDWLPFVPGSSFWVPPRKRLSGLADLMGKLKNVLSEDEAMSLATMGGWPSSSYFVKGGSPYPEMETASNNSVSIIIADASPHPEVETTSNFSSQSEDEEG